MMPEDLRQHIEQLRAQGAHIIYGTKAADLSAAARPEAMKQECGLKAIRRSNATGYHYFIANLSPNDIEDDVALAVPFKAACFFNPLNGDITPAVINEQGQLHLSLRSGESIILQTYNEAPEQTTSSLLDNLAEIYRHVSPAPQQVYPLSGPWKLSFTEESPRVAKTFQLPKLQTWETLDDDSARVTMGTGVYTTRVKLTRRDLKGANDWQIDLGDVRESARVYINGQLIGCAWSVPFVLDCRQTLKPGWNDIRIEVTNLPANRIADYDRRGIKWRKMEEINVVDINYKRTTYDAWEPVPSGLNSEVRLIRR
jgi:hypothetical protein